MKTRIYDGPSMNEIVHADWAHIPEKYGSDWYTFHRADLHPELKRLATEPPIDVRPARIVFGKQVQSVDCEAGIIRFVDGEKVRKDVVVGADGVHVSLPPIVLLPFIFDVIRSLLWPRASSVMLYLRSRRAGRVLSGV